jgi:hypothetical protein
MLAAKFLHYGITQNIGIEYEGSCKFDAAAPLVSTPHDTGRPAPRRTGSARTYRLSSKKRRLSAAGSREQYRI